MVAQGLVVVRERLAGLAFAKHRDDIFTLPLTQDADGWLGLNRATVRGQGMYEINPVIGVRHRIVEATVTLLAGDEPDRYLTPSISTPLGYLMPQRTYVRWFLKSDGTSTQEAAELAAAVEAHGTPFMRAHATIEDIVVALQDDRSASREQQLERLPVALLLAGRPDDAQELLDRSVVELGDRDDPAAERLRSFAGAFRRHVAAG